MKNTNTTTFPVMHGHYEYMMDGHGKFYADDMKTGYTVRIEYV